MDSVEEKPEVAVTNNDPELIDLLEAYGIAATGRPVLSELVGHQAAKLRQEQKPFTAADQDRLDAAEAKRRRRAEKRLRQAGKD